MKTPMGVVGLIFISQLSNTSFATPPKYKPHQTGRSYRLSDRQSNQSDQFCALKQGQHFEIASPDPRIKNIFLQHSAFSGHISLDGNPERPRLRIVTPTGNSGAGIWFETQVQGRSNVLKQVGTASIIHGKHMNGVGLDLQGPSQLVLDFANPLNPPVVLDSVRAIREKGHGALEHRETEWHHILAGLKNLEKSHPQKHPALPVLIKRIERWLTPTVWLNLKTNNEIIISRVTPTGYHYRLLLKSADENTRFKKGEKSLVIESKQPGHPTRFTVKYVLDRPPLIPLSRAIEKGQNRDQEKQLRFLSYRGTLRDKNSMPSILAGSPSYLTYFGRDTMISSTMLADRSTPEFLSNAAASVLDRINPLGQVPHEENIGEQAVFENLQHLLKQAKEGKRMIDHQAVRRGTLDKPVYDIKMVDGEFLAPQLVNALIDKMPQNELSKVLNPKRLDSLARLFVFNYRRTDAQQRQLIRIKENLPIGNWRDSTMGLGGDGVYPLDVNQYLVPNALRTQGRIVQKLSPSLRKTLLTFIQKIDAQASNFYSSPQAVEKRARLWRKTATKRFAVSLSKTEAIKRLKGYLKQNFNQQQRLVLTRQKLWSGAQIGSILQQKKPGEVNVPELSRGLSFPAVALDKSGNPLPIMCSDCAFDLFYGTPSGEEVLSSVRQMFQPFPVGLATPVGLVISNPAYSDRPHDSDIFSNTKYHGTVIWGWVQNMIKKGLIKQKARFENEPQVKQAIKRALGQIEQMDRHVGKLRRAEYWTWKIRNKQWVATPVNQSAGIITESNPLQLWSIAH